MDFDQNVWTFYFGEIQAWDWFIIVWVTDF